MNPETSFTTSVVCHFATVLVSAAGICLLQKTDDAPLEGSIDESLQCIHTAAAGAQKGIKSNAGA